MMGRNKERKERGVRRESGSVWFSDRTTAGGRARLHVTIRAGAALVQNESNHPLTAILVRDDSRSKKPPYNSRRGKSITKYGI